MNIKIIVLIIVIAFVATGIFIYFHQKTSNQRSSQHGGSSLKIPKHLWKYAVWIVVIILVILVVYNWNETPSANNYKITQGEPKLEDIPIRTEYDSIPKDVDCIPYLKLQYNKQYSLRKGEKSLPFRIDEDFKYDFPRSSTRDSFVVYNTKNKYIPGKKGIDELMMKGERDSTLKVELHNGIYRILCLSETLDVSVVPTKK